MVWTVNGNTADVCISASNELLDAKISCPVTLIETAYSCGTKETNENLKIVVKLLTESIIDFRWVTEFMILSV